MVTQFDENRIHSFGAKCEHTSLQDVQLKNDLNDIDENW